MREAHLWHLINLTHTAVFILLSVGYRITKTARSLDWLLLKRSAGQSSTLGILAEIV